MIILALLITVLCFFFVRKSNSFILSKQRCDVLKAFFPFLIIIHHISFRTHNHFIFDFRYSGPYIVGIFFFISGYGLEYKASKGDVKFSSFLRRMKSLLVPVLFPIILYCSLTFPNESNSTEKVLVELKNCSLYLPSSWFVIVLALLCCLFYIMRPRFKPVVAYVVLFLSVTALGGIFVKMGITTTCVISNYAFLVGILFRSFETRLMEKFREWYLVIIYAMIFIAISFMYIGGRPIVHGIAFVAVPFYVFTFFMLYSYIPTTPVTNLPVINYLKNISYEMYLCQGITFFVLDMFSIQDIFMYTCLVFALNIPLAFVMRRLTNIVFFR